jgi:hypothetical protein
MKKMGTQVSQYRSGDGCCDGGGKEVEKGVFIKNWKIWFNPLDQIQTT